MVRLHALYQKLPRLEFCLPQTFFLMLKSFPSARDGVIPQILVSQRHPSPPSYVDPRLLCLARGFPNLPSHADRSALRATVAGGSCHLVYSGPP